MLAQISTKKNEPLKGAEGTREDHLILLEPFVVFLWLSGLVSPGSLLKSTGELLLRSKAVAIFAGRNEGSDHFGIDEVAVELIQLRQPEVITGVVRVLWVIGIAAQVTKVLHQHESTGVRIALSVAAALQCACAKFPDFDPNRLIEINSAGLDCPYPLKRERRAKAPTAAEFFTPPRRSGMRELVVIRFRAHRPTRVCMTTHSPKEITRLLVAWGDGDESALADLIPPVYEGWH